MRKLNVLVVGATGYIGTSLLSKIQDNTELIVSSYSRSQDGDLCTFLQKQDSFDYLINLAHSDDINENKKIIKCLVAYCEKTAAFLIHFSSISIYSPLNRGPICVDSQVGGFFNYYAVNKLKAESCILTKEVSASIIRLGHVFDNGSHWEKKILNTQNVGLVNHGAQFSNYVTLVDIYNQLLDLFKSPTKGKKIINLVSNKPKKWCDLLQEINPKIQVYDTKFYTKKLVLASFVKKILFLLGYYKLKNFQKKSNKKPIQDSCELSTSDFLALNSFFRIDLDCSVKEFK
jgi:dTDP-4-dehydrorhamnose reductase